MRNWCAWTAFLFFLYARRADFCTEIYRCHSFPLSEWHPAISASVNTMYNGAMAARDGIALGVLCHCLCHRTELRGESSSKSMKWNEKEKRKKQTKKMHCSNKRNERIENSPTSFSIIHETILGWEWGQNSCVYVRCESIHYISNIYVFASLCANDVQRRCPLPLFRCECECEYECGFAGM